MLWLLVVGQASLLLAYALGVTVRFAYRRIIGRPMTKLLAPCRFRLRPQVETCGSVAYLPQSAA